MDGANGELNIRNELVSCSTAVYLARIPPVCNGCFHRAVTRTHACVRAARTGREYVKSDTIYECAAELSNSHLLDSRGVPKNADCTAA